MSKGIIHTALTNRLSLELVYQEPSSLGQDRNRSMEFEYIDESYKRMVAPSSGELMQFIRMF